MLSHAVRAHSTASDFAETKCRQDFKRSIKRQAQHEAAAGHTAPKGLKCSKLILCAGARGPQPQKLIANLLLERCWPACAAWEASGGSDEA